MYRVSRSREGTLYGITTHCEDNSSNTEVGNRVFANFNPSSQRLTTRSLLTQRNNDYMKFSWDPMQVVNISRQQKAVCNREIGKLRGLERYFTRQNHIETYKHSNEIDKFRAKLLRLNNLRMLNEHDNKQREARVFPITKSSRRLQISNSTTASTKHNRNTNSLERNVATTKGPENIDLHKRIAVFNKGYNNSCVNTETNNSSTRYPIEQFPSMKTLNTTLDKPSSSKTRIKLNKSCSKSDPVLRGYLKSDKQAINNSFRHSKANSTNVISANDLSAVIAVTDVTRFSVNSTVDTCNVSLPSYRNKREQKSVRFCEESDLCETGRNLYDSRKFTQLVKLANSISGKY